MKSRLFLHATAYTAGILLAAASCNGATGSSNGTYTAGNGLTASCTISDGQVTVAVGNPTKSTKTYSDAAVDFVTVAGQQVGNSFHQANGEVSVPPGDSSLLTWKAPQGMSSCQVTGMDS